MANSIRAALVLVILASAFGGCGEDFSGNYTGTATISNSCDVTGNYNMTLQMSISDSSVSVLVTSLVNQANNQIDGNSAIAAQLSTINANLTDSTDFAVYNAQTTSSGTVQMSGHIDQGRGAIETFQLSFTGNITASNTGAVTPCNLSLSSTKLTLQQ